MLLQILEKLPKCQEFLLIYRINNLEPIFPTNDIEQIALFSILKSLFLMASYLAKTP